MLDDTVYFFLLLVLVRLSTQADFTDPELISRIAFASCSHQDREQPLWSDIARWNPDYFIWLGDAIYADTRVMHFFWKPPNIARYSEQLHKMKNSPDYHAFQKRRTKIVGVWDDHDYGVNDGGAKDDLYTSAVQDMFLHFLDEPESSPRWQRKGLYTSYVLGTKHRTIKLILLDPRSQLDRKRETVLGEAQWTWLDNELRTDPTTFTIVGTGLPLLTDRTIVDKWMLYPQERERLLGMISRRPGTIIISGDSHFGELQCSNTTRGPLFEVMSSGMTHNCLDWIPDLLCIYYIKYVSACNGCVSEPFVDLNFGTITVIWEPRTKVVLEVRGRTGVQIHYVVDIDGHSKDSCPPRHEVPHQIIWRLVALLFVTVAALLLITLITYLTVAAYASILIYFKFDKAHTD